MKLTKEIAAELHTLDFGKLEMLAAYRREALRDALEKADTEKKADRIRGEIDAMRDLLGLRENVRKTLESGE